MVRSIVRILGASSPRRAGLVNALVLAVGVGCSSGGGGPGSDNDGSPADPPAAPVPVYGVTLRTFDEDGAALPGVDVFLATPSSATLAGEDGGERTANLVGQTDVDGRLELDGLSAPLLYLVEKAGYLTEPVVVARSDDGVMVDVRLLRESGPGGSRVVMHFGGDVMLGRRYIEPTLETTAVVTPGDGGESARDVVAALAPLFRAADVQSVNLETVVGTLTTDAAYPKKRFLLCDSARNTSPKPSIALSNRGCTASGVESRPEKPVPPVTSTASTPGSAIQREITARIW